MDLTREKMVDVVLFWKYMVCNMHGISYGPWNVSDHMMKW